MEDEEYSLSDLAEKSGQPPRTIRFYIARGLLSGPEGAGRTARYTRAHLDRLRRIAELKAAGLTLSEISLRLGEGGEREEGASPSACPVPEVSAFHLMNLSDDVQALFRADLPPWRARQVRRILAETARQLRSSGPS